MEQLRQKYQGRDVEFITMYVREPHPHERGFKDVSQPTTYEQKVEHAKQLIDVKGVVMPVVWKRRHGKGRASFGSPDDTSRQSGNGQGNDCTFDRLGSVNQRRSIGRPGQEYARLLVRG